jgi:hypothetical protein
MDQDILVEEQGISLKDLFLIVWKRRILLIIITAAGLFLTLVAGLVINAQTSKVSTIVEFQWDGILSGIYPDGQRFEYTNLFESTVLNQSLDDASLDTISSNDLRAVLKITPIIPNDVLQIIQESLEQGVQISYFATEFKITIDNGVLGVSVETGQELLVYLIENFRNDFEQKYIQRAVVIDYTNDSLQDYDYIDSYDILLSQVQLINNAANSVLPGANTFISTELGIGFNDILVRTNLVGSIELSTMSSRINNYLLSKDKDLLITRYTYQIELDQLELDKENSVQDGLEDLIANYVGGTSTIIIPGLDIGDQLDTDPYLNTLYANLVATQRNIATYTNDIIYNQTRITRLEGNDPLFIVTPEKEAEEIVKVEVSITRSSEILSVVVEDLDILLTEYNRLVTASLVKRLVAPQYEAETSILIFAAVGIVLGGGIGLVTVFILHARDESKKKKESLAV